MAIVKSNKSAICQDLQLQPWFMKAYVNILMRMLREIHCSVIVLVLGLVSTLMSSIALLTFSTPQLPESDTDKVMRWHKNDSIILFIFSQELV